MNTIPLTLDDYKPSYTVLGRARHSNAAFPLSVLLFNRGHSLYRAALIEELAAMGFQSILSVETGEPSPELEGLAARIPELRFICMNEPVNIGIAMNAAMREADAPFVCALWNDMKPGTSSLSSRFVDKIYELNAACLVPALFDAHGSAVPSIAHPAKSKKAFVVLSLCPRDDGEKCLFPFDMCGIYSREKFIRLGGFDWTIENPYWQKVDFGMRAWLWGENIQYLQAFKLSYTDAPPLENKSPDYAYRRFWLKNIAPVHRSDYAELPKSRFWSYWLKSRRNFGVALTHFEAARQWVKTASFNFKMDAVHLADLWEPIALRNGSAPKGVSREGDI